MFTIDQKVTLENLREKNLAKAFFSMNNHQVATPEMMLEEARSYILFFLEPGGKSSAYIGLQLLATGRKLFYSHSSNPFHDGETKPIEEEALVFVEGLGALLDQKDFTQLTFEEKKRWMEEQEIFSEAEPETAEEEPADEAPQEPGPVQQEPQESLPSPGVSGPEAAPQPPQQPVPPVQYQPQPSPQPVPPVQYQPQPAPQPVPPVQYQPQPSPQPVPPIQYQPQPPQQPVQSAPQAPSMPYQPQATPPQAQPAAYEQPTFEKQKEQSAPKHENHAPLHRQAKQAAGRPAEDEETPERIARDPSAKGRQDIMQKAIKAGVVKPPRPSQQREAPAAAGVVSRDREALARLLTSF